MALDRRPARGVFRVGIGTLLLALLAGAGADASCGADAIAEQATVAWVYDGDTVRLADERKVRMLGIDTPEVAHDERPSEPYADAAREALRGLLGKQARVGLAFDRERRDRYGRVLAHLFLPGGRNVQRVLLERGLATTLVVPPNEANLDCYAQAERDARAAGRGIWGLARYRAREARDLPASARGLRRVTGVVQRVGRGRKNLWLNLSPRFALRIAHPDLRYFRHYRPADLEGHRVEARGWVYRRRGELRMRVRHPAALRVLD